MRLKLSVTSAGQVLIGLGLIEWSGGKHHQAIMWCWRGCWGWWWCERWWIPLLIAVAIQWPQSQRRTATLWMRGPIMSKWRSQPLCQEGTLQTNLIWLSPSFSFPLPTRSIPTLFSAEWVFGGVVKVRGKTPKWGGSSGLWPRIGPGRPIAALSHRDGVTKRAQRCRESRRQVGCWQ